METTERFEKAIRTLYTAFHNETLNYGSCSACAVGNMLGHSSWRGGSGMHYIAFKGGLRKIRLNGKNNSGYSLEELSEVERLFILAHKKSYANDENLKEEQFNGVCAVIEYLSKLDGIPNPMDYTKLFEYTEEGAVHELSEQL